MAGFAVTIGLANLAGPPWVAGGNPSWLALLTAVAVAALAAALMVATGATRALAAAVRRAAGRLLAEHVAPPPPKSARLGDGPGWRAMAYLMLKLPAGLAECYAVGVFWLAGLVNLTYPFWWLSFRNHAAGTRLSPVPVITPFDWFGQGHFRVATFGGTFAVFAAGAGMLLAAPWVTRGVVAADRWLIRGLLGPGRTAQRLQDLEQTRALAVDDAAARLRRLERDLHDGAQIRLATLAMNLGMARKKLGDEGTVPDLAAARELVGAAHGNAKDALVELRELARGIHPPVLDNGLADALASLAATSAIPAELAVTRPGPADPGDRDDRLLLRRGTARQRGQAQPGDTIESSLPNGPGFSPSRSTDDGLGGAEPSRAAACPASPSGSPWSTASCEVASPPGGPTRITVELPAPRREPLHARRDRRGRRAVPGRAGPAAGRQRAPGVRGGGRRRGAAGRGRRAPARRGASSTSGCRRPSPTRACAPRSSCAGPTRAWRCSCFSQYVETSYATELLARPARPASATCSRTGWPTSASSSTRSAGSPRAAPRWTREVVAQLLAASRHAGDLDPLTPREHEVLALMAEGRSNAGIAAALVVTEGAVEKHVASIFAKLDLPACQTDHRRVLAVLRYLGS